MVKILHQYIMIIQLCTLLALHNANAILWRNDKYYDNIEDYHYSTELKWLNKTIKGQGTMYEVSSSDHTPDFRQEQSMPPIVASMDKRWTGDPLEEHRPYRWSPPDRTSWQVRGKWSWDLEDLSHYGCYCCTVFKRLRPLATGAVITSRHILTTATSTHLVLRYYKHFKTLENILGAWYDITDKRNTKGPNKWNTSLYMTPARIHFHPLYTYPADVNVSHPIPSMFDFSVWAATYRFFYESEEKRVILCPRGGSSRYLSVSSYPYPQMLSAIVGYQFIKWWKRQPTPFHRYLFRTRHTMENEAPCPKVDWGAFFCIPGNWFQLGLDSGASMHVSHKDPDRWRNDGLIGMHSFGMKLRHEQMVHYFSVIDSHMVLNFIYDSYMGRLRYVFLDERFEDTEWKAPRPKPGFYIPWRYPQGHGNPSGLPDGDYWYFRYWR